MVGPDERHGSGARDVLRPPEHTSLDQLFDSEGLYGLRSAVAAHGSAFGLSEPSVSDLVLVAHELATNAVRHGGGAPAPPRPPRRGGGRRGRGWHGGDARPRPRGPP